MVVEAVLGAWHHAFSAGLVRAWWQAPPGGAARARQQPRAARARAATWLLLARGVAVAPAGGAARQPQRPQQRLPAAGPGSSCWAVGEQLPAQPPAASGPGRLVRLVALLLAQGVKGLLDLVHEGLGVEVGVGGHLRCVVHKASRGDPVTGAAAAPRQRHCGPAEQLLGTPTGKRTRAAPATRLAGCALPPAQHSTARPRHDRSGRSGPAGPPWWSPPRRWPGPWSCAPPPPS